MRPKRACSLGKSSFLVFSSLPLFLDSHLVVVDAFLERQTLSKNRGGALWSGADGPRPGVGRSATWRRG
jgi:hypothetical protein